MTLRFPVALWQDASGGFTASVLDGARLAVYDCTAAGALEQLEKYIAWAMRRERESIREADFLDLELRDHRVTIRPEYRTEETVYPVATTFDFRVTCVYGKRRDGSRQCVAPTLGIRLFYQLGDPIDQLVTEALEQALGRRTPQELVHQLMPQGISLDAIHVRQREAAPQEVDLQGRALPAVAMLLGERRGARKARAIARDEEVQRLVELLGAGRANLLLLGEAGVGKSTVLVEAILQLQRQKPKRTEAEDSSVEERQKHREFWRTSGQRLIAGMKYLGQWEERCEQVIGELAESASVLCVDELLELVRVGGRDPAASVAAFLQPYLDRGELRMVAEATPAELDACRRLLPGFADLFQIVRVNDFSPTSARLVLDRLLTDGARHLKFKLQPGLADVVYRLFRRFQPYASFPGRSSAFVRHLLDGMLREKSNLPSLTSAANEPAELTQAKVLAEFQRETGLPERLMRDDLPLPHVEVLAAFNNAVLGQEAACQAAAAVVTSLKTGVNDPQRPLGVLFFCGPTGVGKTEMAKAIARYLFGANDATDRLLRLDMSEYSGPGAAQRLLLSPDGQPSDFIKRARRQPFTVVLFDEIEKGSPEVHDALLGLLDEGRLTDRYGRVTTFRSAVIIMTSNIGGAAAQMIGFDADAQPPFERMVLQHFRPEFFNRIDTVVAFAPLGRQTIRQLVVRELQSLAKREGLMKANLQLAWSDAVVDFIADAGFDLRYGARPLQRAFERFVVVPLARWLLDHTPNRDTSVDIVVEAGAIHFRAHRESR